MAPGQEADGDRKSVLPCDGDGDGAIYDDVVVEATLHERYAKETWAAPPISADDPEDDT